MRYPLPLPLSFARRAAEGARLDTCVNRCLLHAPALASYWLRRRNGASLCVLAGEREHGRDLELVLRVRRGEPAAREELVQRLRCAELILASLNLRMGRRLSATDLDDLVQDVLLAVLARLERFDGTSTLETWVYSFCTYCYMNQVRRKQKQDALRALPQGEQEPRAADVAAGRLDLDYVHAGLRKLDEAEARTVRLKAMEGLTFDEIGRRLGISSNTAKTRYYRALTRLRELLREDAGEAPEVRA